MIRAASRKIHSATLLRSQAAELAISSATVHAAARCRHRTYPSARATLLRTPLCTLPGSARGFSDRTAADFDPPTALRMIVEEGAVLLDVRSPGEFAGGALPGAVNMDYSTLGQRSKEIDDLTKSDKNTPIVVYCASGGRSNHAKNTLASLGYVYVANLGGIAEAQVVLDLMELEAAK